MQSYINDGIRFGEHVETRGEGWSAFCGCVEKGFCRVRTKCTALSSHYVSCVHSNVFWLLL